MKPLNVCSQHYYNKIFLLWPFARKEINCVKAHTTSLYRSRHNWSAPKINPFFVLFFLIGISEIARLFSVFAWSEFLIFDLVIRAKCSLKAAWSVLYW